MQLKTLKAARKSPEQLTQEARERYQAAVEKAERQLARELYAISKSVSAKGVAETFANRRQAALQMRDDGMKLKDIGDVLGVTQSRAGEIIKKAEYERERDEFLKRKEHERQILSQRHRREVPTT